MYLFRTDDSEANNLSAQEFSVNVRPPTGCVHRVLIRVVPLLLARDRRIDRVVKLPDEQTQRFATLDRLEFVLEAHLVVVAISPILEFLTPTKQRVLDWVRPDLLGLNNVHVQVVTAIRAGIHGCKQAEIRLETLADDIFGSFGFVSVVALIGQARRTTTVERDLINVIHKNANY